jgi:O-antigen/teichoic acid export membrane protein
MFTAFDSKNIARFKRLAQENLWILLGLFCTAGGSLVLVRVLTEFLSPSQYGELSLANTLANLVNQIFMCGLISGIGRFYSIANEKNDLNKYVRDSFYIIGLASIAVIIMCIFLCTWLIFIDRSNLISLIVVTIIFSIITTINSSLSDLQNAARKRKIVTFNTSLDAILKILFAIVILKFLNDSTVSVMIAFLLAAIFTVLSQLACLKQTIGATQTPQGASTEQHQWLRKIWDYAWPFSAWGAFTWAQQASDKWALQFFATTDEVGIYTVLFQLGYVPIGMISSIFTAFLIPIFFQRAGDATDDTRNANVRRINLIITLCGLALTFLCFIVAWFLHGFIFQVFVNKAFRGSSYLLPWFILAGGMFATGQISALKLMSELRSRHLLPVKVLTAVLGVGINVLGAWYAGLIGVTTALVLFTFIYLAWTMLVAHRTNRIPYNV